MRKLIVVLFLSMLLLTMAATSYKSPLEISNSDLRVTQIAGKKLFDLKKCVDCHTLAQASDGQLTPVTNKREDSWFYAHVESESPIVLQTAKSKRRQKRVLKREVVALVDYLYKSKPAEKKQVDGLPATVFDGAYLVFQNNCLNCHAIAGEGKEVAPDLTHVAKKHEKDWFVQNLINPQQFAPESLMPKFDKLPHEDLEKIADYLLTLH